jgi:arylsulfatase A-like enzyme
MAPLETVARRPRLWRGRELSWLRLLSLGLATLVAAPASSADPGNRHRRPPDVLLICIDTLRADRLSGYGYERPTSPEIDRLLARGTRFLQARTVEPLTGPASASMLTSRFPHEHGATRNGLRIRPRLGSLPKVLARQGYETAAFVGNWSLRDQLTGLSEHFDLYREVFSRKRWLGLFNSEATGEDLTAAVLAWVGELRRRSPERPFFLWVQYVEPHAPYRYWEELGHRWWTEPLPGPTKSDRYDTEVAFVDREVGRLLAALDGGPERRLEDTLVVFVADHGESLGDHGYWGHGRYVFDRSLRIPMGIVWPGHVPEGEIAEPSLIVDLAPTVLGLLDLPAARPFRGFDWSGVLGSERDAPVRSTYFQAHKGTVQVRHTSRNARAEGLLEVGRVMGDVKEVLEVRAHAVRIYDLAGDPGELRDLALPGATPSAELQTWYRAVRGGLEAASDLPPPEIDAQAASHLRALGYLD